jgi:diguanylate cyclase (GGDEF)-like protein
MKQRNGAGSKRLVEATHRFIRSEQKLLEVLGERRILKKTDCDHFARDLSASAAKKRSSDVFGSAIAINKKLMATLQRSRAGAATRRVSEADVLYGLAETVQRAVDPREALRRALEVLRPILPYENATLFVLNRDTQKFEPVATVGEPIDLISHVAFARGRGFSSWVASQKKPVLLNDLHREGGESAPNVRSFLSVPVLVMGEVIGVINMSHSKPEAFDEESTRLLALFGLQLAAVIHRVILHQEVQRMTLTDDLTTLYNRRHFDRNLKGEIDRARRYGHKISVVVLDIDNFKSIEERAGGPAAKLVLSDMGKLLKKFARNTDCVARYSEEEFAILLPHTDAREAQLAASRLRGVVEAHLFPRRKKLTVSVGVATYPADAEDPMTLLVRADQALYQARRVPRGPGATEFPAETAVN